MTMMEGNSDSLMNSKYDHSESELNQRNLTGKNKKVKFIDYKDIFTLKNIDISIMNIKLGL